MWGMQTLKWHCLKWLVIHLLLPIFIKVARDFSQCVVSSHSILVMSDGLEIEAVFQSLGPSFDALGPLSGGQFPVSTGRQRDFTVPRPGPAESARGRGLSQQASQGMGAQ
jgi:hypothetical protein